MDPINLIRTSRSQGTAHVQASTLQTRLGREIEAYYIQQVGRPYGNRGHFDRIQTHDFVKLNIYAAGIRTMAWTKFMQQLIERATSGTE